MFKEIPEDVLAGVTGAATKPRTCICTCGCVCWCGEEDSTACAGSTAIGNSSSDVSATKRVLDPKPTPTAT